MSGATNRTSTSGVKPFHRPSTTRRSTSSATSRPDGGNARGAHAPRRAPAAPARRARRARSRAFPSSPSRRCATGRARARRVGADGAARCGGSRGRRARRSSSRASSSRSSSSTAGRFVATTAARSAEPCAGPDVGRYALSSATRRVGMCRRVCRTISSASSTGSSPRVFGPAHAAGCRVPPAHIRRTAVTSTAGQCAVATMRSTTA